MAQRLKAYTALVGNLSLVPSIHTKLLTTACKDSSGSPMPPSGVYGQLHLLAYTRTHTCNLKTFLKKKKL